MTCATATMAPERAAAASGARIGVVTFPGTLDDVDASRAVTAAGATPVSLWHDDADLHGVDAVIVPGGFSYGDYLRAGAIARFAAVMDPLVQAAEKGLPVLGICNGFQILCEAHLLPGALTRNNHQRFLCRDQGLRIENASTAWTSSYHQGQQVVIPVKNGQGRYVADAQTVQRLEGEGLVVARYISEGTDASSATSALDGGNPNGSTAQIAGVCNPAGTVVGLMPHPEHAIDALTGPSTDGLAFFTSGIQHLLTPS